MGKNGKSTSRTSLISLSLFPFRSGIWDNCKSFHLCSQTGCGAVYPALAKWQHMNFPASTPSRCSVQLNRSNSFITTAHTIRGSLKIVFLLSSSFCIQDQDDTAGYSTASCLKPGAYLSKASQNNIEQLLTFPHAQWPVWSVNCQRKTKTLPCNFWLLEMLPVNKQGLEKLFQNRNVMLEHFEICATNLPPSGSLSNETLRRVHFHPPEQWTTGDPSWEGSRVGWCETARLGLGDRKLLWRLEFKSPTDPTRPD